MRMKFVVLVALAALLLCALGGTALAAEPTPEPEDTMTTTAKIKFQEAIFFYDFPDGGGMDIDYGEQELPLGVNNSIPAADGDHALRICERRVEGGKWSVRATMTPMTSDGESFTAFLLLFAPTTTTGLTANILGTGLDERVIVYTDSRKIVEATGELVPGDYDLTTAEANTRLWITAEQALLVEPQVYTGTVTWTLTLEPEP